MDILGSWQNQQDIRIYIHLIWWYIHETSKALYYVFEFKCSKVLRSKKPGLGPCLSYKILRISMLRSWLWSALHKDMYDSLAGATIFTGGIHWILPKNWTLWSFLSLSSLWNILLETFFWCLLVCSFLFKIITYIWADTEKGTFRSNCSFSVSARMYVMVLNGKLHTSKLQKQVSNRIFHKEEKERKVLDICLVSWLLYINRLVSKASCIKVVGQSHTPLSSPD